MLVEIMVARDRIFVAFRDRMHLRRNTGIFSPRLYRLSYLGFLKLG